MKTGNLMPLAQGSSRHTRHDLAELPMVGAVPLGADELVDIES
jgi:hypothetical protein